MKIALDVVTLMQPKTGIGIYTFHLLSEFIKSAPENDYYPYDLLWKQPIDRVIRGSKDLSKLFERLHHLSTLPFPFQQILRKGLCFYTDRFGESFKLKEMDLFFGPCFKGVFKKDLKTVITIHDLAHEHYPEMVPAHFFHYLKRKLPEDVRKASLIIAVSQSAKNDIVKFLDIPGEKIRVIYNGVDHSFRFIRDSEALEQIKRKYHLPERFILYVGAIQPRKNIAGLIKAYHLLVQKPDFKHHLVIAGGVGWKKGEIYRLVEELDLRKWITFTGAILPADLPILYNLSEAFLFPSFYEGFGLPVLEAMACGVPVVTSNVSALPEVAGDAALYVNPHAVDEMAEGILRILSDEDLRKRCITKGLQQAKLFTWERCAAETLQAFKETLHT